MVTRNNADYILMSVPGFMVSKKSVSTLIFFYDFSVGFSPLCK